LTVSTQIRRKNFVYVCGSDVVSVLFIEVKHVQRQSGAIGYAFTLIFYYFSLEAPSDSSYSCAHFSLSSLAKKILID
jgi:hypothetical protein